MITLTVDVLSTPILALHVYESYLLIGEGSFLHIYNTDANKPILLTTLNVFASSSVHGIKKWKNSSEEITQFFLIYGQKSFCMVSLNLVTLKLKFILEEYAVKDWIFDASCLETDLSVIIVTGHNQCLCFSLEQVFLRSPNSGELEEKATPLSTSHEHNICITKKVGCDQNSLLYCSKIIGEASWASCIVLSGTAFGKIHLWAPWTASDSVGNTSAITSISGPKGTIFSLTFNKINNLLGATADDRSIRVWRVCFQNLESFSDEAYLDYQNNWLNCKIIEIFCSFGHAARVWRALILEDEAVLSCGEDSVICHWTKSGSLKSSWDAHSSSNIWCLANSCDTLFTGSSSGDVKRWKLNNLDNEKLQVFPFPWDGKERFNNEEPFYDAASCNKNPQALISLESCERKCSKKNFLRSINLIDSCTIAAVTNDGTVLVKKNSEQTWKLVYEHNLLKGYVISAINFKSSMLTLGTLSGQVIILDTATWKCICLQRLSTSKIQTLAFIKENLLISCTGLGQIYLWTVTNGGTKESMLHLELMRKHQLPPSRQHWITAASSISKNNLDNFYLLVGDTVGSVFLYTPSSENPVSGLKGLHGKKGVTSLKTNNKLIITTGRDGHICYLNVKNDQLEILSNFKYTFGNWICGAMKIGTEMFTPIFDGNKLQLWNVAEQRLISEVTCGGGHRSWDILIGSKRFSSSGTLEDSSGNSDEMKMSITFLKNGICFVWVCDLADKLYSTIKDSTSGQEIRCLEPLFGHEGGIIVSFGGEDTLMHTCIYTQGKMNRISAMKSHLSCIRNISRIKRLEDDERASSNGWVDYFISCGGRAQIKVWKMTLTEKGITSIHVVSDQRVSQDKFLYSNFLDPLVLFKEVSSHMLKPESSHSWKSQPSSHSETRYMDSRAFWISKDEAIFILASSDGFIRFFKYSESKNFTLVYIEDCKFCLLRLCFVKMVGNVINCVASTTRGNILVWNIEKLIKKLLQNSSDSEDDDFYESDFNSSMKSYNHNVLNCGINCLASNSEEVSSDDVFLATGGDDGSIHLLKINLLASEACEDLYLKISDVSNEHKHASQVSGLAWFNETTICSVSTDQRLFIWQLKEQSLVPLTVYFCSIPDIQGLKVIKFKTLGIPDNNEIGKQEKSKVLGKIFVFGQGIQVFDVCDDEIK